jgi:hypothetical protein
MNEIAHLKNPLAFKAQQNPASDGSEIFGRLHLPEYQQPYR